MPLVVHLPPGFKAAQHGRRPRGLWAITRAWFADLRLAGRVLRDEARLSEMDARLLADAGLTREDVVRGVLRQRN